LPESGDPLGDFSVFDPKTGDFADTGLPADPAATVRAQADGDPALAPAPPASGKTEEERRLDRLKVDMPGGGQLRLWAPEEVDLWNTTMERYVQDYDIAAHNDLMQLGNLLTQVLASYRATQLFAGMAPELKDGVPTGRYVARAVSTDQQRNAQKQSQEAAKEIRAIEVSLGLDKKSRESGGQYTVSAYKDTLKEIARNYAVHLSGRYKAYDAVVMEARWKLRLLENGDEEDRRYHNLTPETICDWLRGELAKLETLDQEYGVTKQKLYLGKVR
jgi:hypothetical protein